MKVNLKSNKGITMIVLSIAIIILAIVTSMLTYYSSDAIDIKNLNNMYNDIELLSQKVSLYFYENEKIPILVEYTDAAEKLKEQKSNLDNEVYYVVDLNRLDNLELNYGKEFKEVKNNYLGVDFDIAEYTDLYIINEQSHNIYYIKGVTVDGKTYYKKPLTASDELIDIKVTKISSIEDLLRFKQSVTNGNNYENEYVIMTKNLDFENANSYDGTEVIIDDVIYKYKGENDLQSYFSENGTGWTPIGTETNKFLGTFEGNNYKIINIYAKTEANKELFTATRGIIKNVEVKWK
jgi:type II secretory pathway pseudopilin PulG